MKTNYVLTAALALATVFAGAAGPETVGMAVVAQQAPDSRIGERMPDGTVYAGNSRDTGKPIYTTPADAPGTYKWDKAGEYCARLQANAPATFTVWHVPTKGELPVLFTNRAAIGGFNETGTIPAGRYWSSEEKEGGYAVVERFSDGDQYVDYKGSQASLRCVK